MIHATGYTKFPLPQKKLKLLFLTALELLLQVKLDNTWYKTFYSEIKWYFSLIFLYNVLMMHVYDYSLATVHAQGELVLCLITNGL